MIVVCVIVSGIVLAYDCYKFVKEVICKKGNKVSNSDQSIENLHVNNTDDCILPGNNKVMENNTF